MSPTAIPSSCVRKTLTKTAILESPSPLRPESKHGASSKTYKSEEESKFVNQSTLKVEKRNAIPEPEPEPEAVWVTLTITRDSTIYVTPIELGNHWPTTSAPITIQQQPEATSSPPRRPDPGLSTGTIVGLVVGLVVGFSLLSGVFYIYFLRLKQMKRRLSAGGGKSVSGTSSKRSRRSRRSRRSSRGGGGGPGPPPPPPPGGPPPGDGPFPPANP